MNESTIDGTSLTRLFDVNGERVYLYEIYGYEHSHMYISHQLVSKEDIKQVIREQKQDMKKASKIHNDWEAQPHIQKLYAEKKFEEVYKLEELDKHDKDYEKARGLPLDDRLYHSFGMLRVSCEHNIPESGISP